MLLFLGRLVLAAVGGAAVYASYEPHGLWWAAIVGIGLLWLAFQPRRGSAVTVRQGVAVGFAHSLTQYLLMLPWIGELVGTMPYVALAVFLSLWSLALGWGAALLARWRYGFAAFPFFYLAVELGRSSVPFGGFAWVRLGWGQIDGPLAALAAWGGPALVTVAAALAGCGLAALVRRTWWGAAAVALPLALGLLAGTTINNPDHTVGTKHVAAIQGNVPRLGLDFEGQRLAVLTNHVTVTKEAAAADGGVDFYVWPENSSDINPFSNATGMALIREALAAADAPILVGTATVDEIGERNTMQVFNADGSAGEHHYKKYLQPFGETMPLRSFFRKITDLVDLAGDFKAGDGPGVVDMAGTALGVATCYEVSFDDAFRASVRNGATIMSTPTNNATFGFSDETYQQLAMSRMRAIETDRAVIVPATSGVSALIEPDGTVIDQSQIFEPKYLIADLPLRDSITPAVKYGDVLQALAVAVGLACAAAAAWFNRLQPRKKK